MNKFITETPINTTYAVLAYRDLFGNGYLVHSQADVAAAIADGWEVIASELTRADADNVCRIYKYAGTPETNIAAVTEGMLTHDFTETVEIRSGYIIQEFDLIRLPVNGIWMEGTVTYFDADCVEIDGFIEVEREIAEAHAELIAKAETNAFIIEYGQILTEEMEKWNALIEIAIQASSTVAA
jgi:hypothetical protein